MGIMMMLTVAYFAHTHNWGRDVPFSAAKLAKAALEVAHGAAAFPTAPGSLSEFGVPGGWVTLAAFAAAPGARQDVQLLRRAAAPDAGAADRRHDDRRLHADRGRDRRLVWALFLGLVWYRTLDWRRLVKVSMDTIETTAAVLFIVAAASIFGWMLTVTRVTDAVADWVLAFTSNPNMFLLLANLLMLFVGCFLEPTAAITILVPILLPICLKLGIDPVHFGLVMVLNLMIGLLHPPMGMVLFVLARVAKLSVERTTMAILPWLVPLLGDAGPVHLCAGDRALAAEEVLLGGTMLQAADLTIRLNPADDVVIARLEIPTGTAAHQGERARRRSHPAGHKVAVRAVAQGKPVRRYNQIIGFATRDIARRRARARAQPRDGRLPARLRLFVSDEDNRIRREPGDLPGHRARRRPRRDAQLHRHPHQRELLGDGRADDRRHFENRLDEYPNVDGVVALTHKTGCGMASEGEAIDILRRTSPATRATRTSSPRSSSAWAARRTRSTCFFSARN